MLPESLDYTVYVTNSFSVTFIYNIKIITKIEKFAQVTKNEYKKWHIMPLKLTHMA